jgi:probable O-glycosylation ligase (exosortase A-associated)
MTRLQHPHAEWWRAEAPPDNQPATTMRRDGTESTPAFWALVVFTVILFTAPQNMVPVLAYLRLGLLVSVFAAGAYLLDAFTRRRPLVFSPEIRILACLVAWAIVTVPLSFAPAESLFFILDGYSKSVVIFWLLGEVVSTLRRLRLVVWALSLLTVPVAVTALKNFTVLAQADRRILGYDAPLTANPNSLALVLSMILPLTLALVLMTRRPLVRVLLLAIILVDVLAVVVTFSRGGFLALAAVLVSYLVRLLRRPERTWALAILILVVACLPFVPPSYYGRLATITDADSDRTGSAQERREDMLTAAHVIVMNPIVGAGINQDRLALDEARGPKGLTVHNVYLRYGVDLGLPGLVLFVLLLGRCILTAASVRRQSARRPEARGLFYLAEAVQTSLVVYSIAAFFDPMAYEFFFYYFGGLALAVRSVHLTEAARAT